MTDDEAAEHRSRIILLREQVKEAGFEIQRSRYKLVAESLARTGGVKLGSYSQVGRGYHFEDNRHCADTVRNVLGTCIYAGHVKGEKVVTTAGALCLFCRRER